MTDGLMPAPGTGGGGQDTQSRDTVRRVLPCGRLGCFADFTGSCCIYCGKERRRERCSLADRLGMPVARREPH